MHIELLHASQDLLLQFLLTLIPRKRQRSAPPFKIIHLPPSQESRTGNELTNLLFRIAQFQQHIAPDALLTDDGQRKIHAMQSHPVDFTFPTLPVPESHRIGERAIVEIVTQRQIGLVALLRLNGRQCGRKFSLHLIPGEMNTCIVFQVPVDTRRNVYPGVSSHDDFLPLLIQFEEISLTLYFLNLELCRSPFVDTLQQVIYRIAKGK